MTDIDFTTLDPEPIVGGIPDHKASSGESGEPEKVRPGIFGATPKRGRPRKSTALPGGADKAPPPPKLAAGVKGQLQDLYEGIGALVRPFDEFTGDTIIEQAPKCAKSVYDLAQHHDGVRRFVIMMTTTSVTGAVIFAHLPIILALMRHSSNDRVKAGAGMAYMGLKMSGDDEGLGKLFKPANKDDETE